MVNCVVLVGGMCSGKTTLAKELEKRGFRRIVTYTTRPKRRGEVDGVDYYFITEEEFRQKFIAGFFAESTVYNSANGYFLYGSAKEDYNSEDNTVIVLNPQGVINLTELAFIVYLDLRESVLMDRALERGNSLLDIARRLNDDKLYFEEMLSKVAINLTFKASSEVEYMADVVINGLRKYNSR
jgi:guanylate kinase